MNKVKHLCALDGVHVPLVYLFCSPMIVIHFKNSYYRAPTLYTLDLGTGNKG